LCHRQPYVILISYLTSMSCDHRDLHSFPTRRSSDLRIEVGNKLQEICLRMSFRIPGNNSFTMEPSLFCSAGLRRCSRDPPGLVADRKSTRLNSSHVKISYAVFCLKKKNTTKLYNLTV